MLPQTNFQNILIDYQIRRITFTLLKENQHKTHSISILKVEEMNKDRINTIIWLLLEKTAQSKSIIIIMKIETLTIMSMLTVTIMNTETL